jgi:hypothetical protein
LYLYTLVNLVLYSKRYVPAVSTVANTLLQGKQWNPPAPKENRGRAAAKKPVRGAGTRAAAAAAIILIILRAWKGTYVPGYQDMLWVICWRCAARDDDDLDLHLETGGAEKIIIMAWDTSE